MGPIQVVVQDGNNLVLEVTPTPNTTVIIDRGIPGPVGPMGNGDVDGPASSTDNAVARFDGTTGKLIQNSNVTIDDSGNLTYPVGTANGVVYANGSKVLTTGSALTFDGSVFEVAPATGVVAKTKQLVLNNFTGEGVGITFSRTTDATEVNAIGTANNSWDMGIFARDNMIFATGGGSTYSATTERMRLDPSGNLGIGTSLPTTKLHTSAYAAISTTIDRVGDYGQSLQFIRNGVTGNAGFGLANDRQLGFYLDSTEVGRWTTTGLGIGTSSPSAKLSVYYAANTDPTLTANAFAPVSLNNAGVELTYGVYTSSPFAAWLQTKADGAAWPLVINPLGGNLGIGTSSPAVPLEVSHATSGIMRITTVSGASQLQFKSSGTNLQYISYNIGGAGALSFYDSNSAAERMRLDSSGNVGIGTSSPNTRLSIVGISDNSTVAVFGGQSGGTSRGLRIATGIPSGGSNNEIAILDAQSDQGVPVMAFQTAGIERARIDSSGNLLVGLTTATGVAKLQVSGPIQTTGYTVATLPAGTVGMRTYVTDALAPSFSATVVGGGAVTIPVFYNGTNWIVA